MQRKTLIAALFVVVALAAACVPLPAVPPTAAPASPSAGQAAPPTPALLPAGTDNLAGTSWVLTALGGQPPLPDTTITINFGADATVSGSDGCNTYSTSYAVDGANLKLQQPMASTMMACSEPIMKQATAYVNALQQVATYAVADKQLTLLDASGKTLAAFTAQSTDLAGTSWLVMSYNNGKQAVVSVALGTTLTASFGQDGKMTGNAGCNDYTADYKTAGPKITIGQSATTRKMCAEPQGVMEQETAYLAALQSAATYRIDGKKMEMRTADGALAAEYTKAAAPAQ